jgi:hypothetical protein
MPGLFSTMARGARYAGEGFRAAHRFGGTKGAMKGFGILAGAGAAYGGLVGASWAGQTGAVAGMVPGGEGPLEKGWRYAKGGGTAGLGLGAVAGVIGGALLARRFFGRGMTRPFNRITALGGGRGVSGLLR